MVIAGFQLVYRLVQLVASGGFRLLEGVNPIISRAWEQVRGEAAIRNSIGGNRLAGLVQGVLCAVQRGVTLGSGLAGVGIHLRDGSPPVLPDVLRGGISNVIAGDRNGLRRREDVRIARAYFLQRVRSDLNVLEVRLTIGASGGSHIHCVSLIAGAMQPKRETRPRAIIDRFADHQAAGFWRIRPGQRDICMKIVRAAGGQYGLVGGVLPDGRIAGGHELLLGGAGDCLPLDRIRICRRNGDI